MQESLLLKKSRSNETLNRTFCYGTANGEALECTPTTLYEKVPVKKEPMAESVLIQPKTEPVLTQPKTEPIMTPPVCNLQTTEKQCQLKSACSWSAATNECLMK
jgi:hypothetical protein